MEKYGELEIQDFHKICISMWSKHEFVGLVLDKRRCFSTWETWTKLRKQVYIRTYVAGNIDATFYGRCILHTAFTPLSLLSPMLLSNWVSFIH